MRSIRRFIGGTLLAAAALLAGSLPGLAATAADEPSASSPAAAGPNGGGPGRHGFGPGRIFSKLGLTTAQQQSVQSILTAAQPGLKSLHEQLHTNRLKLRQTKPDDPNYAAVVAQVGQANGTLSTQLTTQEADMRAQLYGVLTPAQKTQLAALEANMEARMQEHGKHWGHHGPGAGGPPPGPEGE